MALVEVAPPPQRVTEVPHDGARAVLAVLQPQLLLTFLDPEHASSDRAVLLTVRLIVNLLLLSHRATQPLV